MAMIQFTPGQLRGSTLFVAVGTILFGLLPVFLPRTFAELFGVPVAEGADSVVPIRSVGARDVVSGIGIFSAVTHGGRVAPWLLGRLLSDATDVAWVVLAFARGARSWRLAGLGFLALGATAMDYLLYRAYKGGTGISGGGTG
jgi:hypothetical protein